MEKVDEVKKGQGVNHKSNERGECSDTAGELLGLSKSGLLKVGGSWLEAQL